MDLQRLVMETAAEQHGAISRRQLTALGVQASRRHRWIGAQLLIPVGPKSYAIGGSPPSWMRSVWCASFDVEGRGFIAGRTAARLHGLDGFTGDAVEVLVQRAFRNVETPWTVHSTSAALNKTATQFVGGVRSLTAHWLILNSPLFRFSREETENAIDSALRQRKISEQRLRADVVKSHRPCVNGSRTLFDAMVDTGGESWLERRFLKLVRRAGLPRPDLQRVYRDGSRFLARVDAVFPGGHVVELEGHGTHATRQERQADERRRNALRRQVMTLTVFTYGHVTYEPDYVVAELSGLGIEHSGARSG
ncbi:MAG TPA: hypothetical protein PKV27_00200 [Ilumatobacteraceae bacterium]|nr:hypothetical protein [Ilumatobacteraceae bacterium]